MITHLPVSPSQYRYLIQVSERSGLELSIIARAVARYGAAAVVRKFRRGTAPISLREPRPRITYQLTEQE